MALGFLKSSYEKVKNALSTTRSLLSIKLRALFKGELNEEALEELEQILFEADLGVSLSTELTKKLKEHLANHPNDKTEDLLKFLKNILVAELLPPQDPLLVEKNIPHVILIIGVNGNGKTTTAAKIAKYYLDSGKTPIFGAADTFRAAAADQLELWASKLGISIVKGLPKSDPASVAFDTLSAAIARHADVVLIDTAGRLHTKIPLMQELEKIRRSCNKALPGSPHETLLVLDATTGQNAIDQAKTFTKYTPISGLVLTKLDGTAKGGMAIAIQRELKIPIKFIGIGEGMEDLLPFDPNNFVNSLLD
ncbi:Signal recognition particle receptor FtsY [Chlamydiales bacterium STE3]|nr:Signal recognition particle receptor FtsY [Chlamydiales bacterium STE3]